MKYTKDCIYPWMYMLIHAGGLMQTCPCASDTEIGDFIIDYCDKKANGEEVDIFNKESLQMIRKSLLTGNLRKMCRDCAFNTSELITVDKLEAKIVALMKERYPDFEYSGDINELVTMHAYNKIGLGLSNKCNLRCIYCNQSTCADTNPFYKAEFPEEYINMAVDEVVSKGIEKMITSVEGEITLYPYWYKTYKRILDKYPHIKLSLTTNLNRKYSDEEIELLARHYMLDVSCDTLDKELYSNIRVNGRLDLLMDNLMKIKQKRIDLNIQDETFVTIHVVVCNLTWATLKETADFAFDNGFGLNIGNYEERPKSVGFQKGILKPVYTLDPEIQKQIGQTLEYIKDRANKEKRRLIMHGDMSYRIHQSVERNYNRFKAVDSDKILSAFQTKYPHGLADMHLGITYDHDNIAYTGIMMKDGASFELSGIDDVHQIVYRTINIYKKGKASPKYDQTVLPGFRSKLMIENGIFNYRASISDESIESVLLEIKEIN